MPAETIGVPNFSFESPFTVFVDTHIDFWQETPKPDSYNESGGFTWDQLTGVFLNTLFPLPSHIDNCDGLQAMYLFAVPQVGLFQDYDSTDWARPTPLHAFNSRFEIGKSYHLTVGVIGGGGGMTNGASLEFSFYYRDSSSNKITIAATNIIHSLAVFPTTTHFVDCYLDIAAVKASDAWAGKNIGVQIVSTVDPLLAGGYWDLDNVRLVATREPILLNPALRNNQFTFTLQSEPLLTFEILASTNLATTNWTSVGVVTNSTGTVSFTNTVFNLNQRFYRARQLP
ncbi:MAG: hypothetical protein M3Y82_11605 [Verrucomicrobiota bacterium]|nr:hypothetical protein [Verrucomicrobiota bacterium]